MLAAACKAAAAEIRGSDHVRSRLYGRQNRTPSGTHGLIGDCVWGRGSSVEAVSMTRSGHKSSSPGG